MSVETVSLCVIALNEENFLPNLLKDLLAQTYPHNKTQIVLVDSGSADNTKAIMEAFAKEHHHEYLDIVLADNVNRIQASGWNTALSKAICDVIIRIDAHTHIPAEFTEKNMAAHRAGEYVSGGIRPCIIENQNAWSRLLLEAENSMFGSGYNICRRGTQKQYVKTMFHGAYRREIFEKVGCFNEKLLRTEDNEMHHRICQAGYKLYFDPDIISYQYARNSLKSMAKQKYANGYWIALTLGVCPKCISLFHIVPLAFVIAIVVTTIAAILGLGYLAALLWSAYGLFTLLGVFSTIRNKKANCLIWLMPLLFLILHVSYGLGTLVGIFKMPLWRKNVYSEPKK